MVGEDFLYDDVHVNDGYDPKDELESMFPNDEYGDEYEDYLLTDN